MQNYILYQAYGKVDHVNECRYSLLKYLHTYNVTPPAQTTIVIYTDQPALFDAYTTYFQHFEMRTVTPGQLKEWRGAIDFVHRVKVAILNDFFTHYSGNLLYFDTDAYITQPLEPLFEQIAHGTFYLHEFEGHVNQTEHSPFYKWSDFLRVNPISYNGKQVDLAHEIKIWNAGVIGMSSRHKDLLKDVLELTDVIYPQFSKHIAEQFAFSYCLQKAGEVKTADEVSVHYWNLKEFRNLLKEFFKRNEEESIPNLVKLAHPINAATIQQQKNAYEQLPLLKKWWSAVTGRRWNIAAYTHKL